MASLTDVVPDDFARLWSLMQMPAINLPVFSGMQALPLGLQVIGKAEADETMLAFAAWIDGRIREARGLR